MIIINVIDSMMVTDVAEGTGKGKGKGEGKGKINPSTSLGSLDFKVIAGAKA